MSFHIGQKVVCVNDSFPLGIEKLYVALPKKGKVYTVREMSVGICPVTLEEGEISVRLMELRNPRSNKPPCMEYGFKEERFRPLVDDTAELENVQQEEVRHAIPIHHV